MHIRTQEGNPAQEQTRKCTQSSFSGLPPDSVSRRIARKAEQPSPESQIEVENLTRNITVRS